MYQRPKEDNVQQTTGCIAERTETALLCTRSENRKGYTRWKNYRGKLKKKKTSQLLILMFSWTLLRSDSPLNLSLGLKISQLPRFLWDLSSPVFFPKHIWTEGWLGLGKENPLRLSKHSIPMKNQGQEAQRYGKLFAMKKMDVGRRGPGARTEKTGKTEVSKRWVPDKLQQSIPLASQGHAKHWCSPTRTSGCPNTQPPFPKSSWSAVPVAMPASGQRTRAMLLRGRKMYSSDNIEGLQLPNTLCLWKHLLSSCCSGKSKMKKDSCKSASSSRKLYQDCFVPVRDVPNYLAAFQISGCPLHLPARAPREYFSVNTTTATLPLLFHFNFSLYVSVFLLFLAPSSAKESPVLQCRAQNKGWDLQLVGRQSITVKAFGNWLLRSAGLLFCVSPVVVGLFFFQRIIILSFTNS